MQKLYIKYVIYMINFAENSNTFLYNLQNSELFKDVNLDREGLPHHTALQW